MKAMTLNRTMSNLLKMEKGSMEKGYSGYATSYAAQRHMLILLSKNKNWKGKRNPSKYHLRLGRHLKEGKSLKEAHKLTKS